MERQGLEAFWTFDSDTLVLADLSRREERFRAFQATTQCRGRCLNGWVGCPGLVKSYLEAMITMFSDEAFLEEQRRRLEEHSGQAFNEMDAFEKFARREGVVVPHAAEPIANEAFDDALASVPGYVASERLVRGRIKVKALWQDDVRGLYVRRTADQSYIRLLTCNMSWMPPGIWRKLRRYVLSPREDVRVNAASPRVLTPVVLHENFLDRMLERLSGIWTAAQCGT